MKRIAAPMIGGMITTTLLCLLVIPVVYGLILQVKERGKERSQLAEGSAAAAAT